MISLTPLLCLQTITHTHTHMHACTRRHTHARMHTQTHAPTVLHRFGEVMSKVSSYLINHCNWWMKILILAAEDPSLQPWNPSQIPPEKPSAHSLANQAQCEPEPEPAPGTWRQEHGAGASGQSSRAQSGLLILLTTGHRLELRAY